MVQIKNIAAGRHKKWTKGTMETKPTVYEAIGDLHVTI